jgi:hypothetical protein
MSQRMASAEQLSIRGTSLTATGELLRAEADAAAEVTVLVKRPDGLSQHVRGDGRERRTYYDGRQFVFCDVRANAYVAIDLPGTTDEAVRVLQEDYGLALPLAGFVVSDPYARLKRTLRHAAYVGEEDLGGTRCHHLAFDEERVVWELWVSVDALLPVRLLAIGKVMGGEPGLGFDITEVDLGAEHGDGVFEFTPPPGAKRLRLERTAEGN